jgi:hypothetical protein
MRIFGIINQHPSIVHRGAFVVVDTKTRLASYAYPTSPFADAAKVSPREAARDTKLLPTLENVDSEMWRSVCGLLQYCGNLQAIGCGVDLGDIDSITYDLTRAEAKELLSHCVADSLWSEALRRVVA